jgi:PPOX class probable F420-dependent enzyme
MSGDTAGDDLARLAAGKYLLLTTFRRDGTAVPTPVWVVGDGDALLVWTAVDSGKVKRLRRGGGADVPVLVGPCDVRGRPTGPDRPATATLLDQGASDYGRDLMRRKYGLLGRLTLWGSRLRRGRTGTVCVRIQLT